MDQHIAVRPITEADYAGIRRIDILTQQQYLQERWDALSETEKDEHLVSRKSEFQINVDSGFCFVAVSNIDIIGFVLAYETLPFAGTVYIRYIAIDPAYQGQGIGRLLYDALIEKAKSSNIKEISTLINLDNPSSMKLHQKVGFDLIDRKEAVLKLP